MEEKLERAESFESKSELGSRSGEDFSSISSGRRTVSWCPIARLISGDCLTKQCRPHVELRSYSLDIPNPTTAYRSFMCSLSTTLQPFLTTTSPNCNHSESSSWKTLPPLRDEDYEEDIGFEASKPTRLTIKMPTVTRRLSVSSASSSSAYSPHSTSPMGGMSFWPTRRRASMGECVGSATSDGWDAKPIKRGILKSPERKVIDLPNVEESPKIKDEAKLRRPSVVSRGSFSGSSKAEEEFGEAVPITPCCQRCIKAAEYGLAVAGEEVSIGAQRKLSRDRENTLRRAGIKDGLKTIPDIVTFKCGNALEGEECESLSKLSLAKVDELGPRAAEEAPCVTLTSPTPPFPPNDDHLSDCESDTLPTSPIIATSSLFSPQYAVLPPSSVLSSSSDRTIAPSASTQSATKSSGPRNESKATPFSLGSLGKGLASFSAGGKPPGAF